MTRRIKVPKGRSKILWLMYIQYFFYLFIYIFFLLIYFLYLNLVGTLIVYTDMYTCSDFSCRPFIIATLLD